jgi:hypothetical protein
MITKKGKDMKALRLMVLACLLASALFMSGCASENVSMEDLSKADYGTVAISQADAEKSALQFLYGHLKDPQSAICNWQQVTRGVVKKGIGDVVQ